MRKVLTAVGALVLIAVLIVLACNKKSNQSFDLSAFSDEKIISEVQPILQSYLDGQYNLATGKSTSTDWLNYQENPSDTTLANKILAFKKTHSEHGVIYTDYTSAVKIDSFQKRKDSVVLRVLHRFTMTDNIKDSLTGKYMVTEGGNYYDVIMKQKSGVWIISRFSYSGSSEFEPWYVNYASQTGLFDKERLNRIQTELGVNDLPPPYNSQKAIKYALEHWDNPSEFYCDFQEHGDCTNFLSQCLLFGGWTKTKDWWADGRPCCDNNLGCLIQKCFSCSWAVAQSFSEYVVKSGRIYPACFSDSELYPGDIVQFGRLDGSRITHSALVTERKVVGRLVEIRVTYRNWERDLPAGNKRLSEIGGIHYGWRVLNKAIQPVSGGTQGGTDMNANDPLLPKDWFSGK
ncbi:amidase domain-containing protein [Niastella populi]|uniref:Putative amidase domain-containing protein n=1 Tax=Niastella populi TaxID=550983 RepID=A0A1V9GBB5_9BACT|nr:amidase domain-containing protein [Niastella populi]OQP67870.1 hypothetical protein A4R26_10210 [Niastella populi]